MKIYFLSARPCALTLNKLYFGITDKFERYAEVNLADGVFAEFCAAGCLPLSFFITEELPNRPPDGCEVYRLHDGIAIYAVGFIPTDLTLRPIAQERFGKNLITLFSQGALHLSLETDEGFFISTLPPSFLNCRLSFQQDLFFVEGENTLAVFTKRGKCVLMEEISSFSVQGNELIATLPLSNRLHRSAKCRWELSQEGCEQVEFTLSQPSSANDTPPDDLIAYAFFECILLRVDCTEFLSEDLLSEKEKLSEYLGNFSSVVLTHDPKTCGLVKKKAERLFEVDYFTVEIENGKITDIRKGAPILP